MCVDYIFDCHHAVPKTKRSAQASKDPARSRRNTTWGCTQGSPPFPLQLLTETRMVQPVHNFITVEHARASAILHASLPRDGRQDGWGAPGVSFPTRRAFSQASIKQDRHGKVYAYAARFSTLQSKSVRHFCAGWAAMLTARRCVRAPADTKPARPPPASAHPASPARSHTPHTHRRARVVVPAFLRCHHPTCSSRGARADRCRVRARHARGGRSVQDVRTIFAVRCVQVEPW